MNMDHQEMFVDVLQGTKVKRMAGNVHEHSHTKIFLSYWRSV